jgi:glycosyltransferase involved in cell wall biosynthesis
MKRHMFRLLEYVAPSTADLVRDAYIGLRGARILALQAELEEIQARLDEFQPSQVALEESLARLAAERSYSDGIAVISAMPPMGTDIAYLTRSTYRYADYPVDIYAPHESFADYADSAHDPMLARSSVRVFELEALPFGRARNNYLAEVYVLGNSCHHLRVYQSLRSTVSFSPSAPVWVHIHEPCLLNLLTLASKGRRRFSRAIEASYGARAKGLDLWWAERDPSILRERGIMGVRALLGDISIERVIVNSNAAGNLLLNDNQSLRSEQVLQLFVPVFPIPVGSKPRRERPPIIGTFGIPCVSKQIDLVVSAVRCLRERVPDVTLLIAGNDACAYTYEAGIESLPFVRVEDCVGNDVLSHMQSVDLSVQLHGDHFEEGSSFVPQLLSSGSLVVVTEVGSSPEYGDVLRCVPPDISPGNLAMVLLDELEACDRRRQIIERYVATHGPEQFCRRLIEPLRVAPEATIGGAASSPPKHPEIRV